MAAVLQFWTDKQSILDGSSMAVEFVPPAPWRSMSWTDSIRQCQRTLVITWDQVVERTPWARKRLNGTEDESRAIFRQPIPVPGGASELELATEAFYKQQVVEQFTAAVEASGQKSTPSEQTPRTPKGRGAILKAHVDKMDMGENWTRLSGKQSGPDMGRPYEPRRRLTDEDPTHLVDPSTVSAGNAPDRSPLTLELDPQSEVTNLLDYDDTIDQDPEILTAVANIPPRDVEMRDEETAPGTDFNPELIQHGFDQHFGRGTTTPGSASPVTPRDDELLDDPAKKKTKKAPGEGRPGSCSNSGQESTGQK